MRKFGEFFFNRCVDTITQLRTLLYVERKEKICSENIAAHKHLAPIWIESSIHYFTQAKNTQTIPSRLMESELRRKC